MPKIKYSVKVGKNEGLVISPSELLEQYFFGTPPQTTDGQDISVQSIKNYIKQAQDKLEDHLSLKFQKQEITESFPFIKRDYEEWGFIQVSYPVVEPIRLFGFINDIRQVVYPSNWLSAKKTNDGKHYQRRLHLVPGSDGARTNSIVYSGITPHLGFAGHGNIPDYWRVTYCTGFDKIPLNIIQVVSKLAAIPVFAILGDLILGAGIASQSISLDGLSQSISSTSSATNAGYGARIIELQKQIKEELKDLESTYVGHKLTAL